MNFNVSGNPFPVLVCDLNPGESVICQKGAMTWMTPNMKMETSAGGIGKIFSKAITGESVFQNTYTCEGQPGQIALGTNCPGGIIPFEINSGRSIIAQKSAFLASEPGVNFEVFFQKKIAAGFFGGEGFIMQKFTGNGMVFLEIDGSIVEYDLAPGQSMIVDTGYLAAMEGSCSIDVESVKGIGNALFGGEGLFNTRVTGPGHIWLQTMPINQFAMSIASRIPTTK